MPQPQLPPEQDQSQPTQPQQPTPSTPTTPEPQTESKTYDEKYVKELREEAAFRRVTLDKAQKKLLEQSLQMHAADLEDVSDLLVYISQEELLDEDGLPDDTKIKEAVAKLLEQKPHLKKIGYPDIGQGNRGPAQEKDRSFSDWLQTGG